LGAEGLNLVGISYDSQEVLAAFSKQFGITYTLLSDKGSATIARFGILNTVAEEAVGPNRADPQVAADVRKYVSEVGANAQMVGIAHPGTFILDPQGRVTSRFFEESYIERNTVAEVLVRVRGGAAATGRRVTTDHLVVTSYPSDAAVAPGNRFALSTVAFVREQFDSARGVYRYLGQVLSPLARDTYRLEPHDVRPRLPKLPETLQGKPNNDPLLPAFRNDRLNTVAVIVDQRDVPALAWRLEAGGKHIVIAGDLRGQREPLLRLAKGADILVLPLLVAADGAETLVLADLARRSGARQLVLTRHTPATLGREEALGAKIREHYTGAISFANDLDCVKP